ncbi:MAG TPA: tetratricopeptide repeat protein [Tepidisphaeraceae bacterium]|nr:tetratricopeptide repeat protein [Tepidisphaeraceae bacterium]
MDVAIECYRAALHEGGPDRQIAFDLAYALATAGRTDDAIAAYRSAIKLDPTFLDAWINLGDLLMSSGFVESAIDAFEEALAIDPDNPAARYNIADALDLLDHPDALTHWNRFVALHPPASAQLDFARQRIRDLSSLVSVRSV